MTWREVFKIIIISVIAITPTLSLCEWETEKEYLCPQAEQIIIRDRKQTDDRHSHGRTHAHTYTPHLSRPPPGDPYSLRRPLRAACRL